MIADIKNGRIISPYGGTLVNLCLQEEQLPKLVEQSRHFPSIKISSRALCDLELMACGAFSPLDRFMGKADYERVLDEMRLQNGALFPIPITLLIDASILPAHAERIVLCDARNNYIAIMRIEEVYSWDFQRETKLVLGTNDSQHPLVSEIAQGGKKYISGEL